MSHREFLRCSPQFAVVESGWRTFSCCVVLTCAGDATQVVDVTPGSVVVEFLVHPSARAGDSRNAAWLKCLKFFQLAEVFSCCSLSKVCLSEATQLLIALAVAWLQFLDSQEAVALSTCLSPFCLSLVPSCAELLLFFRARRTQKCQVKHSCYSVCSIVFGFDRCAGPKGAAHQQQQHAAARALWGLCCQCCFSDREASSQTHKRVRREWAVVCVCDHVRLSCSSAKLAELLLLDGISTQLHSQPLVSLFRLAAFEVHALAIADGVICPVLSCDRYCAVHKSISVVMTLRRRRRRLHAVLARLRSVSPVLQPPSSP